MTELPLKEGEGRALIETMSKKKFSKKEIKEAILRGEVDPTDMIKSIVNTLIPKKRSPKNKQTEVHTEQKDEVRPKEELSPEDEKKAKKKEYFKQYYEKNKDKRKKYYLENRVDSIENAKKYYHLKQISKIKDELDQVEKLLESRRYQ
jgi:hypothetical protein